MSLDTTIPTSAPSGAPSRAVALKKPRRRSPASNAKRAAWIAEKLASAAPTPIPQPTLSQPASAARPDYTVVTYDVGSWRGRYWTPHYRREAY